MHVNVNVFNHFLFTELLLLLRLLLSTTEEPSSRLLRVHGYRHSLGCFDLIVFGNVLFMPIDELLRSVFSVVVVKGLGKLVYFRILLDSKVIGIVSKERFDLVHLLELVLLLSLLDVLWKHRSFDKVLMIL